MNRKTPPEFESILGASLADGDWFIAWDASTGKMYKIAKSEMELAFGGDIGSVAWGNVTGTLSDQTDLQSALGDKIEADSADTLTNKTIDADNNTVSNIGDEELKAGIDAAKIGDGSVSNTEFQYLDGVTSAIQTQIDGKANSSHTHTLTDITDSGDLAALDTVGTAEIDNDAVTFDKIENIATNRVLARSSSGSGSIEALTLPNFRTLINVEDGATADQTGAEIKAAYEGEADTNAFTDAEKSKLSGIQANAQVNDVDSVNGNTGIVVLDADDIDDTSTAHKFVSLAQRNKLDGIEAGAEVNAVDSVNSQTGAVVLDADDIDDTSTTNKFATAAELSKLAGIEAGADVTDTANVTAAGALMDSEVDADIKTLSLPANTTISTFGASLVDDADASAARTTLGLGTLAEDSAIDVAIGIACSDETTALTTGSAKVTFRMPYAMTLTDVRASLTGAGSTSGTTTIDINESGSTILSTKLTIDQGEKTSETAATAAVISDSALADDAEITIDIDAVTGGADETGLKVWLIGTKAVS